MQSKPPNPEVRPMPDDPVLLDKPSAVVQGVSTNSTSKADPTKGTTATTSDQYKTEFVKVYQDAGVIGAAMLTLLVLCVLLGWFAMRILNMYIALTKQRDTMEELRLQYFSKMTEAITDVSSLLKSVLVTLQADHTTQNNSLGNINDKLRILTDRLDKFLFGRPPGEE